MKDYKDLVERLHKCKLSAHIDAQVVNRVYQRFTTNPDAAISEREMACLNTYERKYRVQLEAIK